MSTSSSNSNSMSVASPQTDAPPVDLATLQAAALLAYMQTKITALCVVLLITYSVLCFLCLAMIAYLRRNRSVALRGDSNAARKVLLPAFEPLLWILGFATGAYSAYFAATLLLSFYPPGIPSIPSESFYAGRQFVLLLVLIFMLQKSVTLPALRRAVGITFVLSIYTVPVAWYIVKHNESEHTEFNFWLLTIGHALIFPIFVYVFIWPPGRSSKTALRLYCIFAISQHVFEHLYTAAFKLLHVQLAFNLAYTQLAIGCMCPFFIWRVLKDDTEHWRGMGQRACALQSLFRQRTNVNERISSQGLHVLIEMHRKYIIDFAYLELKQRIGVGSSAVVYNGILHSKTPVAIKVYTPTTVTEETVAEFSHEAALCGALNHPNIVKFYGMCVSPPTICLVSELCQGSLDVVTAALAKRPHEPRRQQFLINLGYMIDAARAVAYIHSFSPAFVHRDIKPSNFLVDAEGNVKLTDFGESRSLPQTAKGGGCGDDDFTNTSDSSKSRSSIILRAGDHTGSNSGDASDGLPYVNYQSARKSEIKTLSAQELRSNRSQSVKMTVKGTVDYMAPEMINGKGGFAAYGEAADVYSLAITMWDVLNPDKDKYPSTNNNHLRVFETVIAGIRPELDPMLHPSLRELLALSWHQDHWRRPSSQTIVQTLERIQEEVSSMFAQELSDELQHDTALFKLDELVVRTVSGQVAAQRMKTMHAVASISEAVRLGNMLMSAGFLHHIKHAKPFEFSDAMYFFDESNIRLCQPFAMLEGSHHHSHQQHDSEDGTVESCDNSPLLTSSSPQWLDQHLIMSKKNRFESRSLDYQIDAASIEQSHHHDGSTTNGGGGSLTSIAGNRCTCRRLGQRLQSVKSNKRLFQRKHVTIPEDTVLTATLLAQDSHPLDQNRSTNDEENERELNQNNGNGSPLLMFV